MITLDRLKIVSPIANIHVTDENAFCAVVKNGVVHSLKYDRSNPMLMIKIDYIKDELVIEFSGKILGAGYPDLISRETIRQCFRNIETLGFCKFDTEAMMTAKVVSADVTRDLSVADIPALSAFLKDHICNFGKFNCCIQNGNLTLSKNVVSRKTKKRLIVYDKQREMNSAENKEFVEANGLSGRFDGLCRFELNLNSMEQLRKSLSIGKTDLASVLDSSEAPIADFLASAVQITDGETFACSDLRTYYRLLLLKECNNDLQAVEARLRSLCKSMKISKAMRPFRALYERNTCSGPKIDYPALLDALR